MLNQIYQMLDPVAFSIGPISVRWYGIAYILGFACAALIIARTAKRWKILLDTDSLLTVLAALAQRKMQQGQRFSCASRRCQGINSRRMIPRPAARFKQLIPQCIEFFISR